MTSRPERLYTMRTLIVTEFVSLDGVMEAPGGEPGYAHSGWVGEYFSDELGQYKFEEQDAAETMLLGRRTYESFYGAWPQRTRPDGREDQHDGEVRRVGLARDDRVGHREPPRHSPRGCRRGAQGQATAGRSSSPAAARSCRRC